MSLEAGPPALRLQVYA